MGEKPRCILSETPTKSAKKVKWVGFITVAVRICVCHHTLQQKETDVSRLQMIGVNMWRARQCVARWVGRGMTIGFRERAMGTDGSWLPPKIPLRKMAGLTYFWTHHVVQIHCTESQAEYLRSEVIILAVSSWTLWDYIYCYYSINATIN